MSATNQKRNAINGIIVLVLLMAVNPLMAQQTCNQSTIIPSAPDERYQDNGNGTVSDLKTGLMWQQCSAGQSGSDCASGSVQNYTWDLALRYPQTLNSSGGFAGHTDWYLPNLNELESLLELACSDPSINLDLFPNTVARTRYWSASPSAKDASLAWSVSFFTGVSTDYFPRSDANYVRLVRVGQ